MELLLDIQSQKFFNFYPQNIRKRQKKYEPVVRMFTVGNNMKVEPKVPNELVKTQMEHSFHVEDVKLEIEKESTAWRSCCFDLHPSSTKFVGKLMISLITIGVCSYQLIMNTENCSAQIGYSSLFSLVVGSWLNINV